MEDLISKVLEFGLGNVIDRTRDPLLFQDPVYMQDCKEMTEFEEKYMALNLDEEQKIIVDDYVTSMNKTMCRANDVVYFAGIRDTLAFLIQSGLLKQPE